MENKLNLQGLKVDLTLPPHYPTTLKKEEIQNFRNILEAITPPENHPEPQLKDESYTMSLAMIIMIKEQIKDHLLSESDKMEISQLEYVTQRASKQDKYIRLQPLINLLDKVLERLEPIT